MPNLVFSVVKNTLRGSTGTVYLVHLTPRALEKRIVNSHLHTLTLSQHRFPFCVTKLSQACPEFSHAAVSRSHREGDSAAATAPSASDSSFCPPTVSATILLPPSKLTNTLTTTLERSQLTTRNNLAHTEHVSEQPRVTGVNSRLLIKPVAQDTFPPARGPTAALTGRCAPGQMRDG